MALPMLGGATLDPTTRSMIRVARNVVAESPFSFRTLTPHQSATVTTLTELIIPETETPGATSAGVTDFIDVILTDWYSPDESEAFLEGLGRLDGDARRSHGADFVDLDLAAQKQTLELLDAELQEILASGDAQSAQDPVAAPADFSATGPDPSKHFMYQLKRLKLTGYFTSEPGMTAELNYQIIPGRYDGCADRD